MEQRLQQFLGHLHRSGTYSYWWLYPGRRSIWWSVNEPADIPQGHVNVYFGLHPSREIPPTNSRGEDVPAHFARSQTRYIEAINCLYAEFDAKDFAGGKNVARNHIKAQIPGPSVVVDSGGGYHAYWLLDEPFVLNTKDKRDLARMIQHAWNEYVQGDSGAKDLARVLRVPGTTNYKDAYKPNYPTVSFARFQMDKLYTFDQLYKIVQYKIRNRREQNQTYEPPADLESEAEKASLALDALHTARVDDYDDWLRVGMSLSELGSQGRQLWESWSRQSAKFHERDMSKFDTFDAGDGIGLGTLYFMADEDNPAWREHIRNGHHEDESTDSDVNTRNEPPAAETGQTNVKQLFLQEGANDEGNAQCVYHLYGDKFLYCDAYGWLYYNGRFWDKKNAEAMLDRAIVDTLKKRRLLAVKAEAEKIVTASKPSAHKVRSCKYLFQSVVVTDVAAFDNEPDLLNVENGVLNLRTGELISHDPEQRFTYCLKTPYDPNADADTWTSFLADAVDHTEGMVRYLQQAVGYSLTGHTDEEILFYIFGPTRSGKGTFTETLLELLGTPLAAEADFTTFTARRDNDSQNFDLAPLKPARFITASESNRYQALNAAKIKQLTGGNNVRCAFKHKTHFEYRPQYKIWLTSNYNVKADVDDDAAWVRLRVIQFPISHAGNEDRLLKHRMKSAENLKGVLAWAVEGAMYWYRHRGQGLDTPVSVMKATQKAREELDYVQQWLDECMTVTDHDDDYLTNTVLYTSYKNWCEDNGVTPKKKGGLTQSLNRKGIDAGVPKWVNGRTQRVAVGIQQRTKSAEEQVEDVKI